MSAFVTAIPLGNHSYIAAAAVSTRNTSHVVAQRRQKTAHLSMIANPATDSSSTPATAAPTPDAATDCSPYDFSDSAFAATVSGEWFGYEATFSARTGAAQTIPERYIPDEFKDWDVAVRGFDSVTSTKVTPSDTLLLRRTRALPSVGCEADAVVPEVAERTVAPLDADAVAGAAPDGSFTAGPRIFHPESFSQRWSVCLAHPDAGVRSRARVEFGRVDEKVGAVVVMLETWDLPFRNGEILPGCGGPNSSFVDDPVLEQAALAGRWAVAGTRWSFVADAPASGVPVVEQITERAPLDGTLFLPRGLSLRVAQEGDGWFVEAGWLATEDLRTVARRRFDSDGELSFVEHVVEKREV